MNIKTIVITGCSAVGKTTLAKNLLLRYKNLALVNSYTTRDKRVEDVNYIHISVDEFKENLTKGDFVDYNEVFPGVFYGTKYKSLFELINSGKIPLLVTDQIGARNYNNITDALVINLVPIDIELIKKRIKSMRTDNIELRLKGLDNLNLDFGIEFKFHENIQEVIDNIYKEVDIFLAV